MGWCMSSVARKLYELSKDVYLLHNIQDTFIFKPSYEIYPRYSYKPSSLVLCYPSGEFKREFNLDNIHLIYNLSLCINNIYKSYCDIVQDIINKYINYYGKLISDVIADCLKDIDVKEEDSDIDVVNEINIFNMNHYSSPEFAIKYCFRNLTIDYSYIWVFRYDDGDLFMDAHIEEGFSEEEYKWNESSYDIGDPDNVYRKVIADLIKAVENNTYGYKRDLNLSFLRGIDKVFDVTADFLRKVVDDTIDVVGMYIIYT